MKLGIIGGAGLLGATTAFCVATEGVADEIVLTDVRENVAASHAMDIGQAVCETTATRLSVGGLDDVRFCDVILNVAGIPERSAASRDDYLRGNIAIFRELAENIKKWGTAPVFVSATNPVDVLNYSLCEMTGLPRERFIGYSRNDSLRFAWAVSEETGLPVSGIDALVIGEHGDGQVPVFSRLKLRGGGAFPELGDDAKTRILNRVNTWFAEYQKLDSGRSSGWTSAVGLCRIIRAIATNSDEVLPCSVIPDGEYGLNGVSIGLPVLLGRGGVREIIEANISGVERAGLAAAEKKIRLLIENLNL